jgi:SMI1-KNR4 cell-wall
MTALDDLVALVPPPSAPANATGDWTALGIALPSDYRELITRYGSGEFSDEVALLPPFGPCTLLDYGVGLLDGDRELRADEEATDPEDYPYPLYPEPGGLLIWATTANGERLCWLTAGEPDEWKVVAWDPKAFEYEEHEPGAVGFLVSWLSGRLESEILPPPEARWFDQPRELKWTYLRLTEGPRPYSERLRILRDTLAPTQDRGSVLLDDGTRQDHFATATWRLTYETAYGHQIRVAYPPEEEQQAREALSRAVELMGCTVEAVIED